LYVKPFCRFDWYNFPPDFLIFCSVGGTMLNKQPLTDGTTAVTFHMPASEWVSQLCVLGDFNGWNPDATPLSQAADGSWTVTVTLAPGTYQFRYFANGENWANDDEADGYLPNEYGSANSVVVIESAAPAAVAEAVAETPISEPEAAPKKKRASKPKAQKDPAAAPKKRAPRKKKTE
jgi:hypothetical protein